MLQSVGRSLAMATENGEFHEAEQEGEDRSVGRAGPGGWGVRGGAAKSGRGG